MPADGVAAAHGMIVTAATSEHVDRWAVMRTDLWSDAPPAHHRDDILKRLSSARDDATAFVALDREDGIAIGFAEAAIRHDYVNGCDTSPVAFLEGIYVCPPYRRRGVAGALCAAIEHWGIGAGCTELASDADWENAEGLALHRRWASRGPSASCSSARH